MINFQFNEDLKLIWIRNHNKIIFNNNIQKIVKIN